MLLCLFPLLATRAWAQEGTTESPGAVLPTVAEDPLAACFLSVSVADRVLIISSSLIVIIRDPVVTS